MKNNIFKRVCSLSLAISISLSMAPLVYSESNVLIPEEDQQFIDLEKEATGEEGIQKKEEEKIDIKAANYVNDKSIKAEIESLDIVGDKNANKAHTINAKAKSENGVLYQFYIKDVNAVGPAWTIIQEYSEDTSAVWTPTKGGEYLYGVHIKDKNSKEALDTHSYIPITIKGSSDSVGKETILESLTIDGDSSVNKSHTIKAKGTSENGVLYQFYIKDVNAVGPAWTIIQKYSEKTSANWTPTKNGEYLYGVHIKDKKSEKALDTHLYTPITIVETSDTATKLEGLDINGILEAKSNHVLKARATSKNKPLYQFYIKDLDAKGSSWTVIQKYSEKDTASWRPEKPGNYWYGVHVKDSKSSKSLDTHIYKDVTITPLAPAELESVTISGVGYENKAHILTAKGTSRHRVLYQFYIKDLKTNRWEVIQEYSTKNTASWTPKNAGDYWYGVHIKDVNSDSNVDDLEYKSFTVNPPMLYNRTEYSDSLEQALDKQIGRNRIYKNGKIVTASRDEIRQYLDPTRWLQFEAKAGKQHIISIEIATNNLTVRSNPSITSSSIATVKKDSVYVVLDQKENWFKINVNGKHGWVSYEDINLTNDVPKEMYQFMVLTGRHGATAQQLNLELKGKGILEGTGAAFIEASKKYNVNEIYLVAHSLHETGNGKSKLATGILVDTVDGKPVTPRVVYNMYGIQAFDETANKSGSQYAYKKGWFNPEIAIKEGAHWISENYINSSKYNQDTLYKMKFNATVTWHQYATDVGWIEKQSDRIYRMMRHCKDNKETILKFDIPKFK